MTRRSIWAMGLILTLAAFGGGSAAQALEPIKFLTNYVFHGRHSPYFVGLEKGFYEEAGFDITILPATGSGFVVSAIDSGQADFGMADAGTVVQAIGKGADVRAFMVFMDISTSGLASLKPYPTPESLEGATIAAGLNDSARVILPIVYDMKGLDPSTVKWEAADPGVYSSLLLSGKVDLYTASIDGDVPALQKIASQQGKDVHFVSWGNWGYDVFGYFLVTKSDRVVNSADQVKRFAEATAKAVKYAMAHPEETAKIMVKHNPNLDYDTTLAQWRQSIKALDTPYVKDHGYGVATRDRIDRTIDLVEKAGLLQAEIAADEVYVSGFVGK